MEEIVYRGHGPHQRKGGGFSTLGVKSQEALDKALSEGWYRTLPEAIEAHDAKKTAAGIVQVMPLAPQPATVTTTSSADDSAPPTRPEIEAKAKELGIKVHPKHKDATLLAKINEALAKA